MCVLLNKTKRRERTKASLLTSNLQTWLRGFADGFVVLKEGYPRDRLSLLTLNRKVWMELFILFIGFQRPKFGWCLVWMVVTAFLDCESSISHLKDSNLQRSGNYQVANRDGVDMETSKCSVAMGVSPQNKSHPSTISFPATTKNIFRGFRWSLILRPTDVNMLIKHPRTFKAMLS